jgi:hypothetical protein
VQADAVGRISSRRALRVDKTRYELFVLLHGIFSLVRGFFFTDLTNLARTWVSAAQGLIRRDAQRHRHRYIRSRELR